MAKIPTEFHRVSILPNVPGQNTRVGSHALLQGTFPTQGLNPDLPHCRQIHYCLSHQGSPILYTVAFNLYTLSGKKHPPPLTEKTTSDGCTCQGHTARARTSIWPRLVGLWRPRSSPLSVLRPCWHSNWDATVGQPSWTSGPLLTGLSPPFPVLWRPLCSQAPDDYSPRAGLRANQVGPGPPSPPSTRCPSTWQLCQKTASEIWWKTLYSLWNKQWIAKLPT